MDYKRREWLTEWSTACVVATIVDAMPDFYINDGEDQINLMHWIDFDDPTHSDHQRNLGVIRVLLAVLSEFHAAYMAALGDSVTAGAGSSMDIEVKVSE